MPEKAKSKKLIDMYHGTKHHIRIKESLVEDHKKLIDMYHGTKHHIRIKESLVEDHKKCGWRLKK